MIPVIQRTGTADRPFRIRLPRLLSCIRLDEVLLLQGTPLLGALFSMGAITGPKVLELLVLLAASSSLVAHVFVLNDWTGSSADLRDPNRATQVFTARGITRKAAGVLCISLLAASLLMLIPFGPATGSLAFALAILSALYSVPWFALKGVPLASSVLHLAGGLLHFLLGYSLFHTLDGRSFGIGGFFALTFAAGHLTHEARDCGSDLLNRIQTNAVKFGQARGFAAGFLLFTAADILLFVLAIRGVVPHILVVIAGIYHVHLWWTLRAFRDGLTFRNIRRLQIRYRVLYAIIGVIMVLGLIP
jgi:4-hydroxybenzoate polyprenyltransferase